MLQTTVNTTVNTTVVLETEKITFNLQHRSLICIVRGCWELLHICAFSVQSRTDFGTFQLCLNGVLEEPSEPQIGL